MGHRGQKCALGAVRLLGAVASGAQLERRLLELRFVSLPLIDILKRSYQDQVSTVRLKDAVASGMCSHDSPVQSHLEIEGVRLSGLDTGLSGEGQAPV